MCTRVLVLAACLSLAAPATFAASPFAGAWRGDWSDAGSRQSGTASLSIGADGTVQSGTVTNSVGLSSPLSGTVADDGQADPSYTYGGRGGGITYRGKGRLAMAGDRLSGTLDFYLPNDVVFAHGDFTLVRAGRGANGRLGQSWTKSAGASAAHATGASAVEGGR